MPGHSRTWCAEITLHSYEKWATATLEKDDVRVGWGEGELSVPSTLQKWNFTQTKKKEDKENVVDWSMHFELQLRIAFVNFSPWLLKCAGRAIVRHERPSAFLLLFFFQKANSSSASDVKNVAELRRLREMCLGVILLVNGFLNEKAALISGSLILFSWDWLAARLNEAVRLKMERAALLIQWLTASRVALGKNRNLGCCPSTATDWKGSRGEEGSEADAANSAQAFTETEVMEVRKVINATDYSHIFFNTVTLLITVCRYW